MTSVTSMTSMTSVTLVREFTQNIHQVYYSGYVSYQGSLYIAGSAYGSSSSSFSMLDSATDEFRSLTDMRQRRRERPGMFVLGNRVHVVAGYGSGSWLTSMSSIGLPGLLEWEQENAVLDIGVHYTGVAVIDDTAYLAGGLTVSVGSRSLYRWRAGESRWTSLKDMNTARYGHCVVSVQGYLFVLGGYNPSPLSSVERYDPRTDEWTDRQDIPSPLYGAACSVWSDLVFMAGGYTQSGLSDIIYIYDVTQDTWTQSQTRMPYKDHGLVSHIKIS